MCNAIPCRQEAFTLHSHLRLLKIEMEYSCSTPFFIDLWYCGKVSKTITTLMTSFRLWEMATQLKKYLILYSLHINSPVLSDFVFLIYSNSKILLKFVKTTTGYLCAFYVTCTFALKSINYFSFTFSSKLLVAPPFSKLHNVIVFQKKVMRVVMKMDINFQHTVYRILKKLKLVLTILQ